MLAIELSFIEISASVVGLAASRHLSLSCPSTLSPSFSRHPSRYNALQRRACGSASAHSSAAIHCCGACHAVACTRHTTFSTLLVSYIRELLELFPDRRAIHALTTNCCAGLRSLIFFSISVFAGEGQVRGRQTQGLGREEGPPIQGRQGGPAAGSSHCCSPCC